ncbi:hypothetical protein [Chryseobacterium sp. SIMBA_038]|uniref:hypothetical protein n=1 Tax=Chryseobacterium sp. SIMBA_038 TaxID=3085780 RepID=UPI00397CCA25
MKRILFPIAIFVISFSCKEKKEKVTEPEVVETKVIDSVQSVTSEEITDEEPRKEDTDYEMVSEKDFKQWKGEYHLDYLDYAGENDGTKLKAKLVLDGSEDGHFYLWYEKPSDTAKLGMHHVYGSFGKADNENTAIKFLPEIVIDRENTGIDLDFFLYNKNNAFYIKSEMIPSEGGATKELPIQKIK